MSDELTPEEQAQWSDRLSEAWERHRDRLFTFQRATSDWIVDRVDPQPGQTILELAAGPGETGFVVAERVGPEGKVISTDLNEGMVAAAQRGVEARGLTNVECRLMDAQAIDLPDDSVDGIICRFGIMLMPEPEKAVAHSRRVLKDGSRLAYAVWSTPDKNPWLAAMAMALMENGHPPPGNPFDKGGPFSLADHDANRTLVKAAGFDNVEIEEIPSTFTFDSFDDYWSFNSEVSGPVAIAISGLTDDQIEPIKESARSKMEAFQQGDTFACPALAVGIAAW